MDSSIANPAGFLDRTATDRDTLETALRAFLDGKRARSADTANTLAELTDYVGDLLLAGGKRLRPLLVLASYRAAGGDRERDALPVALATEMLQAYLLIHDDIMDRAELRRGQPAVHARARDEHRNDRLPGDAAEHGRSMAILAGDLAHTWAVELYLTGRPVVTGTDTVESATGGLDACFHAMCEEVIGGQWLEMRLPLRPPDAVTGDDLQTVLHLKSGRYSVERPLELGARLAGASAPAVATFRRLGAAAGEAFQLQDDLLGVFGDDVELGKSVASDLAEGKHTFLIHYALEAATPAQRQRLEAGLGRAEIASDPAEIAALREILEDTGARRRVETRVEGKLVEAQAALADLEGDLPSLTDGDRSFFTGLLTYLKERTR